MSASLGHIRAAALAGILLFAGCGGDGSAAPDTLTQDTAAGEDGGNEGDVDTPPDVAPPVDLQSEDAVDVEDIHDTTGPAPDAGGQDASPDAGDGGSPRLRIGFNGEGLFSNLTPQRVSRLQ